MPVADAGSNQTITLPTNSVKLSGTGTDSDGSVSSYSWTKVSGPSGSTITNSDSAITNVSGLKEGTYQFQLMVTDNDEATGTAKVKITVNSSSNKAPVADAGSNQTITLPTNSVKLSGTGTDSDGSVSSYSWTKVSGPSGSTIANPDSAITNVSGLKEGTYQYQLMVTDNDGATGTAMVQITVNPKINIPPTSIAGSNQTIVLPTNNVTLRGSGTDPDGIIASYLWTKISGPSGIAIRNPNSANTIVSGLVQGVYQFELQVTDDKGAVGEDTVKIIVNVADNIAPTANAGSDKTITLPINNVTLSGSGTDPDGTIKSYEWTKITGPSSFSITNPSSAITNITGLVQGTYEFELKVTDNKGDIGTDTVNIKVNAAANIPPTADAGSDQTITLPTNSVTLSGNGTDADGKIASYLWSEVSGPSSGNISNPDSASTNVVGLSEGKYIFKLKVTDNYGATGESTVAISVKVTNQAPSAHAGSNQVITLPTNSITLSGSGTDADGTISSYSWIKISGLSGETIKNPSSPYTIVNGLIQGDYIFELTVTDNQGATGTDTIKITVNPAINIPPTSIAGSNQTIVLPTNNVTLRGSGTDPDGTIASYLWTKVSGPSGITIGNPNSANTIVSGLVQGVYQFELQVTDDKGAVGEDTVKIIVNVADNIAPTANAGSDKTIILPSNSIALSGSGTDPDGTIKSYEWTKITGPSSFSITNPSSAITNITSMVQGTYEFELKVTDNKGDIGTDIINIKVNAANNQPPNALAGSNQVITLPTNSITLSGSGTDADGTISSYSWTKISGPLGETINSPSSAYTTVNRLLQGNYIFELTVTDNQGATGKATMKITVNPANNQAPTANAGSNQVITLPTNTVTLSGKRY